MYHVGGGQLGLVIVTPDALPDLENPCIWILDFPRLRKHPHIIGFLEIPVSEAAIDLAPHSIHQRNTI
jgi:hypothetical protein